MEPDNLLPDSPDSTVIPPDPQVTNIVDDLISQLAQTKATSVKAKQEKNPLTREQIEDFVISKSGELVEQGLDAVENLKNYMGLVPDPENASALASMVTATAGALDVLNKQIVTDRKNTTTLKAKEMDVQSRKELQNTILQPGQLLTREEMLKAICDKALNLAKPVLTVESEIIA
jgi:hypothetical protein